MQLTHIKSHMLWFVPFACTLALAILWGGFHWRTRAEECQESLTREWIHSGRLTRERDEALSAADYQTSMRDYWKGAYRGSVETRGCDCVQELQDLTEDANFHLQSDMEEHGKLASCYACAPNCRESEE